MTDATKVCGFCLATWTEDGMRCEACGFYLKSSRADTKSYFRGFIGEPKTKLDNNEYNYGKQYRAIQDMLPTYDQRVQTIGREILGRAGFMKMKYWDEWLEDFKATAPTLRKLAPRISQKALRQLITARAAGLQKRLGDKMVQEELKRTDLDGKSD